MPQKKKVLLINPRKGWRPALGLLYIASSLRQSGYEVKVIEFVDEIFFPGRNRELWQEFYRFEPDFIGLGVISWNRSVAKSIIEKIRATTSGKIIICGGKDPSFKPEVYLDYGSDYAVLGEGEETIVELLDTINSGGSVERVRGLAFKKEGHLVKTEERPPSDVNTLPFPAFDLVNYKQYCNIRLGGIPGHFIKTGFLMANRGCVYRCRFCTDPIRNIYRERTIDNIIEEIKWQIKNWKIDGLVLLDDLFCFNEERVRKFCERVLKEGIRLKFYAQARVDRIGNQETLNLMRKAGFIQLAIGMESGSQRMLDVMNKGCNVDQIRQAIERINKAGIHSYAFLIIGFPEESIADLEATVNFLKQFKPTFVTVNYFMPMPGTEYYNKEDKLALEDLTFSLTERPKEFRSPVPPEEILRYRAKFFSLAQRSADLNLLRYPSFYLWLTRLFLLQPQVIVKGINIQRKKKTYTNYFEAVRTSMINHRIYAC